MDGVPNISFPPIKPGTTFVYEFPIRQKGTYWYHSHTNLQEQKGLYGAIVIEPSENKRQTDLDHVILLSDWTTENPSSIIKTLKSGSEWYSLKKGSGQSIFGAAKVKKLGNYFTRELQRMPPMDIADVAYDYFLVNGKPESSLHATQGKTIRLRIINGSATTYFFLEFAGGDMQIVSSDGQDVVPLSQKRFLIGVAETYDVIISLSKHGSFEFRATAHDGSGFSSTWIGSGPKHYAKDIPKPNLYHSMDMGNMGNIFALTPEGSLGMTDSMVKKGAFDKPGMMKMETMSGSMDMGKSHSGSMEMKMPSSQKALSVMAGSGKNFTSDFRFLAADVSSSKNLAANGMSPERPWPPYAKLRSIQPTSFAKGKPRRDIRLTLDGDMERYIWLLNKKTLSESDSIKINKGEVVRFIMINRTMMHHPMHLHGHFFRVINGQGDYSPLKHTVNVAPMATTVIEFDANESGDWFFHCHLLYHMKSGMARLIHYQDFNPPAEVLKVRPDLFKESWYFQGKAAILSNMTQGFLSISNTRNILNAKWEAGWHSVDEAQWEVTPTFERYINRFFSVFVGANSEGEKGDFDKTRGIAGFHYLLPLNIESQVWADSDGGARLLLEKELQLTPRLGLILETQYDSRDKLEGSAGLGYRIYKNIEFTVKWHSEYKWGAGLVVNF